MTQPLASDEALPTLRVLVVDDEPLARRHLCDLLAGQPVGEVEECADGAAAVEAINRRRPDLVLLDVAMPELDGFGVIEAIGPAHMPPVIFVTAHDEHAVRAFEVHALDYLLKPISSTRFRAALATAMEQIRQRRAGVLGEALRSLLDATRAGRYRRSCLVRHGERMVVVDFAEVEAIESAGNYVRLHVADGSHLFRSTLTGIEAELDPQQFVRIHRCHLIHVARVKYLEKAFQGELAVTLRSGKRLPLQRRYVDQVKSLLGG
jgi:two-component system, LytTR family, response regulator